MEAGDVEISSGNIFIPNVVINPALRQKIKDAEASRQITRAHTVEAASRGQLTVTMETIVVEKPPAKDGGNSEIQFTGKIAAIQGENPDMVKITPTIGIGFGYGMGKAADADLANNVAKVHDWICIPLMYILHFLYTTKENLEARKASDPTVEHELSKNPIKILADFADFLDKLDPATRDEKFAELPPDASDFFRIVRYDHIPKFKISTDAEFATYQKKTRGNVTRKMPPFKENGTILATDVERLKNDHELANLLYQTLVKIHNVASNPIIVQRGKVVERIKLKSDDKFDTDPNSAKRTSMGYFVHLDGTTMRKVDEDYVIKNPQLFGKKSRINFVNLNFGVMISPWGAPYPLPADQKIEDLLQVHPNLRPHEVTSNGYTKATSIVLVHRAWSPALIREDEERYGLTYTIPTLEDFKAKTNPPTMCFLVCNESNDMRRFFFGKRNMVYFQENAIHNSLTQIKGKAAKGTMASATTESTIGLITNGMRGVAWNDPILVRQRKTDDITEDAFIVNLAIDNFKFYDLKLINSRAQPLTVYGFHASDTAAWSKFGPYLFANSEATVSGSYADSCISDSVSVFNASNGEDPEMKRVTDHLATLPAELEVTPGSRKYRMPNFTAAVELIREVVNCARSPAMMQITTWINDINFDIQTLLANVGLPLTAAAARIVFDNTMQIQKAEPLHSITGRDCDGYSILNRKAATFPVSENDFEYHLVLSPKFSEFEMITTSIAPHRELPTFGDVFASFFVNAKEVAAAPGLDALGKIAVRAGFAVGSAEYKMFQEVGLFLKTVFDKIYRNCLIYCVRISSKHGPNLGEELAKIKRSSHVASTPAPPQGVTPAPLPPPIAVVLANETTGADSDEEEAMREAEISSKRAREDDEDDIPEPKRAKLNEATDDDDDIIAD